MLSQLLRPFRYKRIQIHDGSDDKRKQNVQGKKLVPNVEENKFVSFCSYVLFNFSDDYGFVQFPFYIAWTFFNWNGN